MLNNKLESQCLSKLSKPTTGALLPQKTYTTSSLIRNATYAKACSTKTQSKVVQGARHEGTPAMIDFITGLRLARGNRSVQRSFFVVFIVLTPAAHTHALRDTIRGSWPGNTQEWETCRVFPLVLGEPRGAT